MPYVNDLSIAFKFDITAFLGIPRDFRVFHNSFALPTPPDSFFYQKILAILLQLTFERHI